jgi:hypothetical protein
MAYNGEGIQHIALICDDLIACWDRLEARGVPFMTPPPDTYYEMLEERLPGHGEPVEELRPRGILLDGSTEDGEPRLLLQIFSQTLIGPVFFEFIQRKKDEGFGEGNFTGPVRIHRARPAAPRRHRRRLDESHPAHSPRRLPLQRRRGDGGVLPANVLGMDFQLAIAEDRVPSTGEPDPYMHVFLDAGMRQRAGVLRAARTRRPWGATATRRSGCSTSRHAAWLHERQRASRG